MTKGDKNIGRYLYLQPASENSDSVNDLRIKNVSGAIVFEKCTVANATKGAGTWVEDCSTIDMTTAEFSGAIDETNDKFTIYDFSLLKWLRFSFTNLKSYLKTYFDNIYQATLGYTPENVANKENSTIDTSTTKYPTVNLLKSGLDAKQAINLKFTDTSASSWVADTTYTNYGYKCELTLSGVASTDVAEVTFGHTEAISGNYSPVCLTSTDKVTIYAKVNTTITIPTILINKQS